MLNYHEINFLSIIKYAIHEETSEQLPKLCEPIDWKTMSEIAKAHNLFPIFHEVACKFQEYKEQLYYVQNMHTALVTVAQQIKKTETFLALYRAFLEADIHPIVMKGIVCRQLYGRYGEHRPSGDEDILVRVQDFQRVRKVMEERGFVCARPDVTEAQLEQLQDVAFREKQSGFLIEVHVNAMGHDNQMRTQMRDSFKNVFLHTQTLEVRDVLITVMSPTDQYLYLILHAFKHFSLNGVGLRQMLDILLFQEAFEQKIDWQMVKKGLEENHSVNYLGDLQFIGTRYLGFKLKEQFTTCDPEILLEDMLEVGVFGKTGKADLLGARINLSTMDQERAGIRTWIRAGFPSIEFMVGLAPYLREKPWLLPVEWGKRWGRFFKRTKTYKGNLMVDGIKKGNKRKRLLKKYGL